MNTIEDKLAFISIKSNKRLVLERIIIYVLCVMTMVPLGYGVYKLLMLWDYKKMKYYIEHDIMQGYDKLYDYTVSIQNDEIKNTEDFPLWTRDILSWEYSAFEKGKMPRYSKPAMGNIPFSFTSIEKSENGYDIKKYIAEGIAYKTLTSDWEFLKKEDEPANVYNNAFHHLNETFSDYKLLKGSNDDITLLLPPSAYIANKKGYNESHISSKFHSIDNKYKESEHYRVHTSGLKSNGYVETYRSLAYYSYEERYLQIKEHPYNQLGKIILFFTGSVMILSYLCLIIYIPFVKRKLRLSGYIWITEKKSDVIIFQNPILRKSKVRIINVNEDKTFTYSFSKDGSRILLSNGDIYTLKTILSKKNTISRSNIESIEMRTGNEVSIYHNLNNVKHFL